MAKSEAGNSDQLLDENDRWSNCDDWRDEEGSECLCPFCTETLASVAATFDHCIQIHHFDFKNIQKQLKLDFYDCVKLVNYVRREKPSMSKVLEKDWIASDEYLVPVVEDDPLLYSFGDEESEDGDFVQLADGDMERTLHETKVELETLKEQFESYKQMVQKTFMSETVKTELQRESSSRSIYRDNGNYYYDSYAGNEIHEQMLKDTVRTDGYRDFIYNNKSYFKNKTVMDVGCGTGILSMFAAMAGALHVYAVDNSDIIEKAKANVIENGLHEKITFLRGKVEDVELPCKVDIIISEWMGYFLLFEGMLDSVLTARDKWLKEDGIMAPSKTTIHLSAFGDDEWYNDHIGFWHDVYGFKMTAMTKNLNRNANITVARGEGLVSNEVVLTEINTRTVTSPQLDFTSPFELNISKQGKVYAFCGWFDTFFEGKGIESVMFSTSPRTKTTHWVQTLFVLNQPLVADEGDVIIGTLRCKKSAENPRELDVKISYRMKGSETEIEQQFYVV